MLSKEHQTVYAGTLSELALVVHEEGRECFRHLVVELLDDFFSFLFCSVLFFCVFWTSKNNAD
jgi:hypothetical protein